MAFMVSLVSTPLGRIAARFGRAEFIFFSHNSGAYFWEVWKWPGTIRWSRLFQSVD